jgi:hypothetical protein
VVKPGNAIEQTGFTRPIGTDNGHQFTGADSKVDLFDRNYTAKAQAETFNRQFGFLIFFIPVAYYRWPAAKSFHESPSTNV